MQYLREEYAGLLENRDAARVIFISVDPERDTPQALKDFASYYDPSFVGLTAT